MSCPNCKSNNLWDDCSCWGCNDCSWCSLAGLNNTKTASNPNDANEVRLRALTPYNESDDVGYYEEEDDDDCEIPYH